MKVLGSGQVRNALEVTADAFSDAAEEKLEAAGGEALLTERAQDDAEDDSEADADAEQDEE